MEDSRLLGSYDDAVIGAGILGLAHAYELARRGRRVVVLERDPRAAGASVRNFGMLWPIGQPSGPARDLALRSLEIWWEVLRRAGVWHDRCGSLHLAYHDDEAQVVREFLAGEAGPGLAWHDSEAVLARVPWLRRVGLRGALWSAAETVVDPRETLPALAAWLAREFGVVFQWGGAVTALAPPEVRAGAAVSRASRVWVCSGAEIRLLYPEALQAAGLSLCKLQMLRTRPWERRLGALLAAGLTLGRYPAFRDCPTLPALQARLAADYPEQLRWGIHGLVAQNALGELVLGDSHEYGSEVEPFDREEIDQLILEYVGSFLAGPPFEIAARWHGVYPVHPSEPFVILRPETGVTVVTVTCGAGMTLAFGLAEQVIAAELGAHPDRP